MAKMKKAVPEARDYKAEYQRRIARGLTKGLSRSQARGHPKASETSSTSIAFKDRSDKLEKALKMMKDGLSQKKAAQILHISAERLRAFMRGNTDANRTGRKWVIRDNRPEIYWIATAGRMKAVTLTKDEGSKVGLYWNAVHRFLDIGDYFHLDGLKETGVRDVQGKYYPFELGPNRLRRLESIDELNFLEIYADVAR